MTGVQVVFVNFRSAIVKLVIKGGHDIIDNILRIAVAVSIEWAGLRRSRLACRFGGGFGCGGGVCGSCSFRRRGAGGQGEQCGSKDKG